MDSRQRQILKSLARLPDLILTNLLPETGSDHIRAALLAAAGEEKPEAPAIEPDHGFRLFTDGASRGNPGEAGAGFVLLDDQGREILAQGHYLGQCTNNVAEYRALILGLGQTLELGCRKLDIFLDSELIVRQLNGQYKVKNQALRTLFAEVQSLLARLSSYRVKHVPRADNSRADELANRGIDEK